MTMVAQPEVSAETAHVRLEGLEKRYGDQLAVEAMNLSIRRGELLGFLGPSGCGKSTTLRMVGGLVGQSAGRIMVGGRDVSSLPPHRRNMGIVFQNYALFPHMSVEDNIGFGLRMRKRPKSEVASRTARMLAAVHLEGYGKRGVKELSGGQQQRVALARALAIEPDMLLLDEPLSNLDAKLREQLRLEIRDVQRSLGITTIFVTHDQAEALAVCDRLVVMRDGRIEQVGSAYDVYEAPASPFVAGFVGRINRLEGKQHPDGAISVGGAVISKGRAASGPLLAMIRPHRVHVKGDGEAVDGAHNLPGRIKGVSYLGDMIQYEISSDIGTVYAEIASATGLQAHAVGEPVTFGWKSGDVLIFPPEEAEA